ncbi:CUB domain-containing protein 1 [Esox lucius]|uniref:CUB domain-containing protein 1 n=1 Tax=Esox lucius TaxID=8010 RepID=UPI001476EB47|nr:CUB domain-containing protein 1 [Esox lucius]
MTSTGCGVLQFWGLLASAVFVLSAGVRLTITPVQGTTLIISQSSEVSRRSACTICNGTDLKRTCSSSGIILTNPKAAESVEFTCPKPEEVFTVTVVWEIECTMKSCNGDITPFESDTGTLPLQKFNRTFIWNLKAPVSRAFHLNFNQMGLRQIHPSEQCPDQHTYTLLAHQDTGEAAIGTYCRNGSVSGAQVLNQGRFSLEIPGGWKLKPTVFNVSVGEEIKSLAVLKVILPEGTSSSMFLSPNYPDSFPDDDQVEWEFMVPPKHNTTVLFLNSTQPQCLKKEPAVEYHYGNMPFAVVKKLSDPQPTQRRESFSMILRNCEMNKIGISSNGLSVRFQVSANLWSLPVLCNVDLRNEQGLTLYIRKTSPKSNCELKLNSFIQENITIPSGKISQLSFQDCPRQKLILTASRIIECHQWKDCPAATAPIPLTVPVLESCLPAHLANIDWTLRPPQQGTVELLPLNGSLRQSLPGHKCYGPDIIIVDDEEHGTTVGQFCPQGAISKIQVQTKVSIKASIKGGENLQPHSHYFLKISFTKEIGERYIFTVRPKSGFPTILATPSWPMGMKSFSTVSWIVSVPSNKEAHLLFTNISQPKCSKQHTSIRVQSLGSLKEMYSQQEDKKADREITISESFYLNMSNCMPEKGDFSVLTEITLLHKDKHPPLTIILSVVAAIVVLMVVVLAVICSVIRKRKGQLSHQVSVYNPNGTNFLPGHNRSYPKSGRDDQDESPIYACIDETLVYSHLLLDRVELGVRDLPVDVYHSFTGPTEDNALSLGTVADIPEVGIYQPFVPPSGVSPHTHNGPLSQELSMVNNELYGGIHSQSQPENMFTKQAPMLELEAEDLNGEQR